MNRALAADALARTTAIWSGLLAESDAELYAAREEAAQLRAALAQEKAAREADRTRTSAEAFGLAEKVQAARSELDDRVVEIAKLNDRHASDVADYEETVADLRGKLRDEEARRVSYQAVDAAARRFVAEYRKGKLLTPEVAVAELLGLIPRA